MALALRTRDVLALVVLSAVMMASCNYTREPQMASRLSPIEGFDHYERLAAMIERCPQWPTDRFLTAEELDRLRNVARAFQSEDVTDVSVALLIYADRTRSAGPDEVVAWTKPMLLLRTMFDIPPTERRSVEFHAPLYGRVSDSQMDAGARHERYNVQEMESWPISSQHGQIGLQGYREIVEWGGPRYQMHLEYIYFDSRYSHREL